MNKFYFFTAVFFANLIILSYAYAGVNGVDASPNQRDVGISQTSTFTVNWEISRSPSAGPFTVVGQAGEFRLNGDPVASTRTITRNYSNGLTTTTLNIAETVTVPRHVVLQAQRTGSTLEYSRSFADDGFFINNDEVTLIISGSSAGEAGIANQILTFDDGTDYKFVTKGEKLHAIAKINTSGSGVLRAVWEVAEYTNAGDQPFFRPLQNIVRPISYSSALILTSPELPTAIQGRERVRLRVISPAMVEASPAIDYFVTIDTGSKFKDKPFEPKIPANKGGGLK